MEKKLQKVLQCLYFLIKLVLEVFLDWVQMDLTFLIGHYKNPEIINK